MSAADFLTVVTALFFVAGGLFFVAFVVNAIRRAIAAAVAAQSAERERRARERDEAALVAARRDAPEPPRATELTADPIAPTPGPSGFQALGLLAPMQRRFVMADLLGPPVSMREDGSETA